MNPSVSFSKFVAGRLSSFQLKMAIGASLILSMIVLGISIKSQITNDQALLQVLSPYIGNLIESQDRPEILRLLESVSEDKSRNIILIKAGRIYASSRNISEMDEAFASPSVLFKVFDASVSKNDLITSIFTAENKSEIYIFRSVNPIVVQGLLTALVTFLMCLGIALYSSRKMRLEIKIALAPLERLRDEIEGIHTEEEVFPLVLPIREFEDIRNTISETKRALNNAKDAIAEQKAKKLSAESYKRLIHDLHTPVAALGQMVTVLTHAETTSEDRQSATEGVPLIAGQILNQIIAAKKNLEHEPEALRECDLRESVQTSINQVRQTLSESKNRSLTIALPESRLMVEHDPILLRRAIINLVENALEASRESVRLTLESISDLTVIRVEDDSPGIEESKISLYLQGKAKSNKGDRQAFGLSSVNHIVRAHGGRVVYKRSDMGGANFEIRLGAI